MPVALLMFLKNNWLAVGMGVVIALLLAWIGILKLEVGHYQHASQKWEQAYKEIKNYYEVRQNMLDEASARITKDHQETLKRFNQVVKEKNALLKERIQKNEELRNYKLSLDALRLFNESKRHPDSQEPATTQPGDDGKAGTSQGVTIKTDISLADLFTVSAENDANHWKCIKQVDEWQNFWIAYKTAVEAANKNASSP